MTGSFSLYSWLIALCALVLFIKKLLKFNNGGTSKLLPPGPQGLPLLGSMFDLGGVPHRTFHKLQSEYGPIVWLKLGSTNTVVVQSAEAAAQLFKKCDIPFVNRNVPDALTALGYNRGSVAFGRYSDYWRRVRRISSVEFLVNKRVLDTMSIRRKCVEKMIERVKEEVAESKKNGGFGEIQLGKFLFSTSFETIGNIMLSKEVMDSKVDRAGEFHDAFLMFLEWVGKPNLVDFLPFLKWLDPQMIRRKTGKYLEILLGFASEIVKERIQEKQSGKEKITNDFLDALLDDEGDVNADGPDKLSVKNITIVLLEMFFGGTETTSSTIEWGMTEFLRHPDSMRKIQDEIDRTVGRSRVVEESDLDDMPYLQATVKEILRLYPPIPMLLPRKAMEDTQFMGYVIPKNTQILVNAWAIHRDPAGWTDPLSFKPDRFLHSDVDFKGQHFQMIPFGSGRRSCVGLTLGHRMVILSLARLLQAFDWKLSDGVTPEAMDMREMMGLTLRKLVPLKAIPTPRD